MGNGNAEENAQDRQAAFKSALTGKHLPVLTLDNKWYRLLNKTGSVPLKETEDALNQLLKRQGKLNTESKDIRNLKKKVDCGVDFLTTQMFFDNNIFYNFLYRIREQGITIPVLPGIMPVTNGKQIARICQLSGTILPERFRAVVDCFGDNPAAMQQAGIAYATDQIVDLIANGIRNIHIYSMNKPEIAGAIMENLSEIIKA